MDGRPPITRDPVIRRLPLTRLLRPAASAVLVLGLAASPLVAAPAANQWAAVPASGGGDPVLPGRLVWGAETGPDGRLYAFGAFTNAGGDPTADYLAVRNPVTGAWSGLGSDGHGNGAFNSYVYDVAFLGTQVIAVGAFTNAGGDPAVDGFAVWDGASWQTRSASPGSSPFATGTVSTVDVLGSEIYIGGSFQNADGVATADRVARWSGTAWSGLVPAGATTGSLNNTVLALDALPDGRVVVAGTFTSAAGDVRAARIAWFDKAAQAWRPFRETGQTGPAFANGQVSDIAVIGTRVYAAGSFENVSGDPAADFVAAWDGTAWAPLGRSAANSAGGGGPLNGAAVSVRTYGTDVIVAGSFTDAGGTAAGDCVAAWNGSSWLSLGTPAPASTGIAMCTHGSISGRTYTATGDFTSIGGLAGSAGIAQFGLPSGPTAPTTLAVTSGARSLALTWGLPASTGGSPITDYLVQYRVAGTTPWKTFADGVRTTRSAVITGLSSGVTYEVRVAARNAWASGTFSVTVRKAAG